MFRVREYGVRGIQAWYPEYWMGRWRSFTKLKNVSLKSNELPEPYAFGYLGKEEAKDVINSYIKTALPLYILWSMIAIISLLPIVLEICDKVK